jgi:hypothetical protein
MELENGETSIHLALALSSIGTIYGREEEKKNSVCPPKDLLAILGYKGKSASPLRPPCKGGRE